MVKKVLTPFNIYTLLWLIVGQNPSLHLFPDSVAVLILFVLFAWSLVCFYKVLPTTQKTPYLKGLSILLLLFSIHGLLRVAGGEHIIASLGSGRAIGPREYIIGHWKSILPIFGFLYFTNKNQVSEKSLLLWFIVFIICSITNYYYEENNRLAMIAAGSFVDGVTNNQSYSFVALMAFLPFLHKRPLVQYSALGLFLVFIIMGMKRGAIVVGALCLILFLFRSFNRTKGFKRLILLVLSIAVLAVGYYIILWYMQNNAYFMMRVEETLEGGTSGRDSIYGMLWNYFKSEMNIIQILFGLGADGTFKAIGQAAHNDWLEILIDTGVLGISMYAAYWLLTFKTWWSIKKRMEDKYFLCVTIIFTSLFIKTIFSMSINDILIYTSMPLGYCLSMYTKSKSVENVKN